MGRAMEEKLRAMEEKLLGGAAERVMERTIEQAEQLERNAAALLRQQLHEAAQRRRIQTLEARLSQDTFGRYPMRFASSVCQSLS